MRILLILASLFSGSASADTAIDSAKKILEDSFGSSVRSFSTQNFGRAKYEEAISVIIPEKGHKKTLFKIRNKLPEGVIAYIGTTRNLSREKVNGVELVVLGSKDKLDILKASATDGINYDITTEVIIEKLKVWDEKYNIDIWHAETDTLQLTLEKLPNNLKAFSQEVYEFCPDIVDQGSGNLSDISDYLRAEKAIYLWWD